MNLMVCDPYQAVVHDYYDMRGCGYDYLASGTACDDNLFCSVNDVCDGLGSCVGGGALDCSDGVSCTDDFCNDVSNSCDNVLNDGNCLGADVCHPTLDCIPDPCTGVVACSDYLSSGDCSSNFCNVSGAGYGCSWNLSVCEDFFPPPGVIYVDNQLTTDCAGTYSIANRDCSGTDGIAYDRAQDAADVVNPGDVVYFRNGTYYNHYDLSFDAPVMTLLRSGTASNPITFMNYNNEEVILSGTRIGNWGHRHTVVLGIRPVDAAEISGQGVQNIIIDGLIFEGSRLGGLMIAGPVNRYASAVNPTENVTVRNSIFRYNNQTPPGNNDAGRGIITRGKLVDVLIEDCEIYNNYGTGISIGANGFFVGSEDWHLPEPDDDMSAGQRVIVRNCLIYNNSHPTVAGNTGGISGSHMYNCTFEDNVVFGNSDDGLDSYASFSTTMKNNIVFGHLNPGGNQEGIKISAGGGGRHTIMGNIAFNNGKTNLMAGNPSRRMKDYSPSRYYNNLLYRGSTGFYLGTVYDDLTRPGFDKSYLRNNIGLDNYFFVNGTGYFDRDVREVVNGLVDSNYNFWSSNFNLNEMINTGQGANSLTGNPGLVNKSVVIDTAFGSDWNFQQKMDYIRSQVNSSFNLASGSQLIDNGIVVVGYHCANAGDVGDCRTWYGSAPDIGAYEYR